MNIYRLKELRAKSGLSQTELAAVFGFSNQRYNYYETGKREPDNDTLIKFADYFKVSTDYLLGKTDDPRPTNKFGFDDFTFALHSESRELSDEQKDNLLEIARGLNLRRLEKLKEKEKEKEKDS